MKRAVGPDERSTMQNAKTMSEVAYQRLRADILWGRAAPGIPLRSADLQATYKFGVSPLREALTRLAAEGLVTLEGQRGFRVAPISAAEVKDLLRSRLLIECEALRLAIEAGDHEWESNVLASFHRLSRAAPPNEPGEAAQLWAKRHREFHQSLLTASGSPILLGYAALLFDKAERYRLLDIQVIARSNQPRNTASEHETLMQAALDRNGDAAIEALRHHYQRTAEDVLAALDVKAAA